jgi:hypothetical protein
MGEYIPARIEEIVKKDGKATEQEIIVGKRTVDFRYGHGFTS